VVLKPRHGKGRKDQSEVKEVAKSWILSDLAATAGDMVRFVF
jgi:hypothetical protein